MYVRRVTTTGSVRTGRKLMAAGVDLLSERGGAELGGTGAKGEDDADHVYFRGENDDTGSGIGREGTTPADVADDADERFESMYVICVYVRQKQAQGLFLWCSRWYWRSFRCGWYLLGCVHGSLPLTAPAGCRRKSWRTSMLSRRHRYLSV